jgi:peptide/nickel transport system permease protein
VAFLGISTPSFMLGLAGLWLLGLQFRFFPIGGMQTAGVPFALPDFAAHLALPAMILGLGFVAVLMRYTRASMLEVIGSLYVTTAESKGLLRRTVIVRHAFRNALIPILTVIGLSLPELVGGAVITETVFSWPGIGLMMVDSVQQRDYPMIMGVSLMVGIAVLAANLLTDVLYAATDPRIRY